MKIIHIRDLNIKQITHLYYLRIMYQIKKG